MTDTTTAPATTSSAANLNEILIGLTELFDRATEVANGTEISRNTLARFVHDGQSLICHIDETLSDSRVRDHFTERACRAVLFLLNALRRVDGLPKITPKVGSHG